MKAKPTVKRKQPERARDVRAGAPQTPPARAGAEPAGKQPKAAGAAGKRALTDKVSKTVKKAAGAPVAKGRATGKANARAAVPKDPGRHCVYSALLRDKICDMVAAGKSWRDIEAAKLATQRQLSTWLRSIPEFHEHYSRAREARAESIVADIEKELADLGLEPSYGQANAAKIRIDTLKWQVSCYYPRMYGAKVQLDATVTQQTMIQYDYSKLAVSEARTLRALLDKCRVAHEQD